MNKFILIIAAFLSFGAPALRAQDTQQPAPVPTDATIQAQKLAFIAGRMALTPEEAKAFLPIYKQQLDKLKTIRKSAAVNRNADNLSEAEAEAGIVAAFDREAKLLEVKKEYYTIFKSILPIKKVAKLYEAEKEFNGGLIAKLQNKSAQK